MVYELGAVFRKTGGAAAPIRQPEPEGGAYSAQTETA
jgi:hypothetical protein